MRPAAPTAPRRPASTACASRHRAARGSGTLRAATLAALAGLLFLAAIAHATEARPHPPFALDGTDALCAAGSPVVNCGSADGSAERPYVIEGIEVNVAGCAPSCPEPARCGQSFPSLVAICNVDARLVLRNVTLVTAPSGSPYVYRTGLLATMPVALTATGTFDLRFEESAVRGPGALLHLVGDGLARFEAQATPIEGDVVGSANTAAPPVMYLEGASAQLRDLRLSAAGRTGAILAVPPGGPSGTVALTRPALELVGTEVAGPALQGFTIDGYNVTVRDSRLVALGAPRDAASSDGTVTGLGNLLDVRRGRLTVEGTYLEGPGPLVLEGVEGSVQFSTFGHVQGSHGLAGIAWMGEGSCPFLLRFNDLPRASIVNHAPCELDASLNWWDGAPRAEGAVRTDPVLDATIAALPAVTVDPPAEGGRVERSVHLAGRLSGAASSILIRGPGLNASVAPRGPDWEVLLDARDMPVGTHEVSVRACQEHCYRPAYVTLHRVRLPRAPIAILVAEPPVAAVGETYRLDASGSFSPDGLAVAAYRFDGGDWVPGPTRDVVAAEPGDHPHVLEVRDEARTVSVLPARVTVRVLAEGEPVDGEATRATAGPAVPAFLLALAVAGWAGARRWR